MKNIWDTIVYVLVAKEHRPTRFLIGLTSLVIGWSFAGILHGFGVAGF